MHGIATIWYDPTNNFIKSYPLTKLADNSILHSTDDSVVLWRRNAGNDSIHEMKNNTLKSENQIQIYSLPLLA